MASHRWTSSDGFPVRLCTPDALENGRNMSLVECGVANFIPSTCCLFIWTTISRFSEIELLASNRLVRPLLPLLPSASYVLLVIATCVYLAARPLFTNQTKGATTQEKRSCRIFSRSPPPSLVLSLIPPVRAASTFISFDWLFISFYYKRQAK